MDVEQKEGRIKQLTPSNYPSLVQVIQNPTDYSSLLPSSLSSTEYQPLQLVWFLMGPNTIRRNFPSGQGSKLPDSPFYPFPTYPFSHQIPIYDS